MSDYISSSIFILMSALLLSCASHEEMKTSESSTSGVTSSYESAKWLEDFDSLKKTISTSYVNMNWVMEKRHLDLPGLNQRTAQQLLSAKSDEEAFGILKGFVKEFHDPHFVFLRPRLLSNSTQDQSLLISKNESGKRACEALGSSKFKSDFLFRPEAMLGFDPVQNYSNLYPVTTLKTNKGRFGFIRIPSFDGQDYLDFCAREWEGYAHDLKTDSCDEHCQERFLENRLVNRLLAIFQDAIVSLEKKHVRALVVDLTNNGGGSGWDMAIAQMLTTKTLSCGSSGDLRHPQTATRLEKEMAKGSEARELRRRIIEARNGCDLSNAWKDPKFLPTCSMVMVGKSGLCRADGKYHFQKGLYNGPVILLVNGHTASAAEDIVARLQDNGAASVIGNKTLGAGCGYVDGGISTVLPNSKSFVKMPNCARYNLNGVNEIEGISPDVVISEPNMDAKNIAEAIVQLGY